MAEDNFLEMIKADLERLEASHKNMTPEEKELDDLLEEIAESTKVRAKILNAFNKKPE